MGSELRESILKLLADQSMLPKEIAVALAKHRSSVSRALSDLREKGLVSSIESESRTRLYALTARGRTVVLTLNRRAQVT